MQNPPAISIIIPVFNEEKTVSEVLETLHRNILNLNITFELIVVNDGSTDKTKDILSEVSYIKLVSHKINRGYSTALKTGIEHSSYDWILTMDADGSHPAHQIPDLLAQTSEYDLIIGARTGENAYDTVARGTGRKIITAFAQYISKTKIPDINSGFRLFKKELARKFWHLFPDGFSFSTTLTVASHVAHYAVTYVPIDTYKRKGGKSTIKPFRDFGGFFSIVLRLAIYFKPLRVFIPLSAFFMAAALITLISGYILRQGILDATFAILMMTAIQTFIFGLIAEMIVKRFYS